MGEIITQKELCEIFKITPITAYRWRKLGLPFMQQGKVVRYDRDKVQAWLEDHSKKEQQK